MSIAIPVYAAGSIATYSDLLEEVRDLLDNASYPQNSFDRALRKAEAHFNRELRTPDMETTLNFTATSEYETLPADLLELRFVYQDNNPDTPLRTMSPAGLLAAFNGRAGVPMAYAIEGGRVRIGPSGTTTLTMVYFARIPALTEASVSNWLLEKHPDLYVAGVMYHLARRDRDTAEMQMTLAEVEGLIQRINQAGAKARWGAGPLIPAGIRQVSSRIRA